MNLIKFIYLCFTETSLQKVQYLSIVFKMAGIASNGGLPQCTNAVKKTSFGKYQTIGVLSKHKLGYLKRNNSCFKLAAAEFESAGKQLARDVNGPHPQF